VAFGAAEAANSAAIAGLPMQMPYSLEQRIILAKQGIPAQEQGNSRATIEMIIG